MAKGGGAWKVAYADFITAMMAFFLVMWICGQDNKIKQAIARYFNNPLGVKPIGESPVPDRRGNIFNAPNNGEVPKSEAINLGMGRRSFSTDQDHSATTHLLSDYITSDDQQADHWAAPGRAELSRASQEAKGNIAAIEQKAIGRLSDKMKAEFVGRIPPELPPVYRDLLFQTLTDVNWDELADDVISQ